jgi:hypothetical protein
MKSFDNDKAGGLETTALVDFKGMYFDSATSSCYQDVDGTIPVTEEGQLVGSVRCENGTLILVQPAVANRPIAIMSKHGHFVPEFTLDEYC